MQHFSSFLRHALWQKLLIMLLCCSALFVGTSNVSFASSRQAPKKEANFSLLPYGSSQSSNKDYFVLNVRPGELLQEQMRVSNSGNITGTARLTSVDATTGQNSGVVYLTPGQAQHNVGPWMKMSTQQVTLAPGQSKIVQFQVSVPTNASSGQHIGGIVAQDMALQHMAGSSGKSNFQVAIQRLTIIPIELKLPGPQIEQLAAKGIQIGGYGSKQTVDVGLQSTSNVMIKPHGTLQITDTNGTILQKFAINMDAFLPQTSINYSTYVKGKALGIGSYLASLTLNYGSGNVLTYSTSFTVTQQQLEQTFGAPPGLQTPWGTISLPIWAIILIALAAIMVLFIIVQKVYGLTMAHRRKKAKSVHEQVEESHEQLDDHAKPTDIFHKRRNKIA